MAIIKTKRSTNFTTIPNELVNDPRLKWNDLGLLVYLLSKPETWSVRVCALIKDRNIGRDAVYEILKRLREYGYARLIKYSNGTTEWIILDEPDQEKPDQEKPDQDFPHVLVKKEVNKRKIINKEIIESKGITLSEFLIQCKENQESAIPEDDAIFDYANKVGIPIDFLRLGWIQFKFLQSAVKRQKDWRAVFRNYVKLNYLKVWFIDNEGKYCLTTLGKQLEREVA